MSTILDILQTCEKLEKDNFRNIDIDKLCKYAQENFDDKNSFVKESTCGFLPFGLLSRKEATIENCSTDTDLIESCGFFPMTTTTKFEKDKAFEACSIAYILKNGYTSSLPNMIGSSEENLKKINETLSSFTIFGSYIDEPRGKILNNVPQSINIDDKLPDITQPTLPDIDEADEFPLSKLITDDLTKDITEKKDSLANDNDINDEIILPVIDTDTLYSECKEKCINNELCINFRLSKYHECLLSTRRDVVLPFAD